MKQMIGWEQFIEGLRIMRHYIPRAAQHLQADHDIIWVAAADVEIQIADKIKLEDLGFYIDESNDCWAFVV